MTPVLCSTPVDTILLISLLMATSRSTGLSSGPQRLVGDQVEAFLSRPRYCCSALVWWDSPPGYAGESPTRIFAKHFAGTPALLFTTPPHQVGLFCVTPQIKAQGLQPSGVAMSTFPSASIGKTQARNPNRKLVLISEIGGCPILFRLL